MKRATTGRLGLVVLIVFALAPAVALAQGAQAQKVATVEGITEYRLDNGLRVLLFPDSASSKVAVNMTVLVGSRHEGYGEAGMAHLLEHMLFKGTPTFPKVDKALQEHGAGRTANGTTWVDRTNYYEIMPATDRNLEFGIKFEADRLVNAWFNREHLATEMKVVRNEFESGENDPSYVLSQRMFGLAFEWHNYGKSTIGNRADIERVPIDRLRAFYEKYYRPDNVVLTIAGKFDPEKAIGYVTKYFGALKRPAQPLAQDYTEEPAQDGERNVTLRRVGKVALVGVMYHIPAASHPDHAPLYVLNTMLVSEPRGRLYKALVETKKATNVSGSAFAWHDPGVLEITASVNTGVKPEEVRDIMLDVVENLAKSKITEEEVSRAREKLLAARERSLTRSERIATELSEWIGAGDWRLLFITRDRIAKVTPQDVERVATKYLRRTNRTLGMYIPTSKVARTPVPPAGPIAELVKDYKGGPGIPRGEPFDPTPANVEARTKRLTLPGGLKVALLPKKTRGEAIAGTLVLHFGNEQSLKDYQDAADFLGPLMRRGTKKLTHQEINDELDVLRASLNASSGTGQLSFSFQTRRDKLGGLLALLREILRHPSFPEKEFVILRGADRQNLEEGLADPTALARNALRRHLNPYPKDSLHYVPTIPEAIERLDRVKLDEVVRLYREQVGGQHGELVLVGDFDPDAAVKQIEALVDGWKAQVPYQRVAKKADLKQPGGHQDINTPDKENAIYLAGYLFGMSDTDPEYVPLLIGNYILGGSGLTSRIFGTLREEQGLSYGAGSSMGVDAQDRYGSLTIFAIANPENLKKADKLIPQVLQKILKGGITEAELADAQKGYLQDRKVARASDSTLAAMLRSGLELGRTMKFAQEIDDRIAALTVTDVNRALRAYLIPNRLFVVHAGDFAKIGKQQK
ncbi:MAG: insulinase family protein [Gemmataceae bacterium]|nr:insulinase family protein [Gemmataceae bacterium]